MNPLIFIAGGVIAATLDAIINKTNQKDDDQLNLTIDDESTINENTLIENEETKPHETKQNGPDNDDSRNGAGGGDSVRIEETTTDNIIEKDRDNAKQISTDDSGNNGGNSSGTDASTDNT